MKALEGSLLVAKRKIIISCKQKTNERIFFAPFFLLFFLFVIEWKFVVCTNENQLYGKQIKLQNQTQNKMNGLWDVRRKWEGKNKFYDLCMSKGICSGYCDMLKDFQKKYFKLFLFKVSLAWLQINILEALFSQSFTWIHRKNLIPSKLFPLI